MHICVSKLTIIGSDNGVSPGRRQAIIWTNAGILLIGPLGANFNETSIEIHTFRFKKIHLKLSSGKWRPQCDNSTDVMLHSRHSKPPLTHNDYKCHNPWTHFSYYHKKCLQGIYPVIILEFPWHRLCLICHHAMMGSWHGNIFCVTGHL